VPGLATQPCGREIKNCDRRNKFCFTIAPRIQAPAGDSPHPDLTESVSRSVLDEFLLEGSKVAGSTSAAFSINVAATGAFTLSVAPTSVTVTASQAGTTTVTVTPTNGFNQQVQFSCSNLPEGIDCEFEPRSLTPHGGPVTMMLAVSEEAEGNARVRRSGAAMGTWFGGGPNRFTWAMKTSFVLVLGCELLLLAGLWRRRKSTNQRGGLQFAFAMMLLLTVATFAAGCTGAPPTNNTGTTTITVIDTGPNNQTATATLSVNIHK
jgi:hypothetical protein